MEVGNCSMERHRKEVSMMVTPFPTPGESDAAHRIAMHTIENAGLQHDESSGAKSAFATDALASILTKAKAHHKVDSGGPTFARMTIGPRHRRFDVR